MKKKVVVSLLLLLLVLLSSCVPPNNNGAGEDDDAVNPDLTTINGVYQYSEIINGKRYTATITISSYDDYLLINNPEYSGSYYPAVGVIKTVENPKSYWAMPYTDNQIEQMILEAYARESAKPNTRYDVSSYEAFRKEALEEIKGADGTEYSFKVYLRGFGYRTANYETEQIIQLAGFELSDAVSLSMRKSMFGENLYFMKKNDFSRLYCFRPDEQLMVFTKIE